MQYVVENYKKWVDLAPLSSKLEYMDLSSKELAAPTETGNRDTTKIDKKIYELELKKLG